MGISIYSQLKKYFKTQDALTHFLKEEVFEIFQYQKFGGLERALLDAVYEPNAVSKNNTYYRWITVLHFIYGIPLKYFDLPDGDLYIEKIKPIQRHHVELHQLKEFEARKDTRQLKADEYFEASKRFLLHIKKNLFIYDYLNRFSNEKSSSKKKYIETHEYIFSQIEKKLVSKKKPGIPKIRYARFLALPIGTFSYSSERYASRDQVVRAVIDHCPVPLFKHICRCLLTYPSIQYQEKDVHDNISMYTGGFYLVPYATRGVHYAYVNEGQFCLTEYYRYNRKEKCKPDLLFIEDNKGELSTLSDIYKEEIQKLFASSRYKLRLKDIASTMEIYRAEIKASQSQALLIKEQNKLSTANPFDDNIENIQCRIEKLKEDCRSEMIKEKKMKYYIKHFPKKEQIAYSHQT